MSTNDPRKATDGQSAEIQNDRAAESAAEERATAEAGAALASDITALAGELAAAKDRALRAQAELENYRKRADRQVAEDRQYANLGLLRDLLPVWDNVHRAIAAAQSSPNLEALLSGVKLIAEQLEGVMRRHRCVPIEAEGAVFDPNIHEAVATQPSGDVEPNTVLHVAQVGFKLGDRVVRPAQVVLAVAPPSERPA